MSRRKIIMLCVSLPLIVAITIFGIYQLNKAIKVERFKKAISNTNFLMNFLVNPTEILKVTSNLDDSVCLKVAFELLQKPESQGDAEFFLCTVYPTKTISLIRYGVKEKNIEPPEYVPEWFFLESMRWFGKDSDETRKVTCEMLAAIASGAGSEGYKFLSANVYTLCLDRCYKALKTKPDPDIAKCALEIAPYGSVLLTYDVLALALTGVKDTETKIKIAEFCANQQYVTNNISDALLSMSEQVNPESLRVPSIKAIGNLNSDLSPEIIVTLRKYKQEKSALIRIAACRSLLSHGIDEKEQLQEIVKEINDNNKPTVLEGIKALGVTKVNTKEALSIIEGMKEKETDSEIQIAFEKASNNIKLLENSSIRNTMELEATISKLLNPSSKADELVDISSKLVKYGNKCIPILLERLSNKMGAMNKVQLATIVITFIKLGDEGVLALFKLMNKDERFNEFATGTMVYPVFQLDAISGLKKLLMTADERERSMVAVCLSNFGAYADSALPMLEEARNKASSREYKKNIEKAIHKIKKGRIFK